MSGTKPPSSVAWAIDAIPGASDFKGVERALLSVLNDWMRGQINRALDADTLERDDYRRLIALAENNPMAQHHLTLTGGVGKAKVALGETLLNESHAAQAAAIDRLLTEHVGNRDEQDALANLDPREATRSYVQEKGNATISRAFFQELVDTGEYPTLTAAAMSVSQTHGASPETARRMKRRYNDYIAERAREESPDLREAEAKTLALGQAIIDQAKANIGLSPRHAAQVMGRSVVSGRGARGIASRAGWAPKQMDQDTAELMQLVGKALPRDGKVVIGSKKDIEDQLQVRLPHPKGRSFQVAKPSSRADRSETAAVCLSGNISKRVLFHEVGHALETLNPAANAVAYAWLKRRTQGYQEQSLRELTGIRYDRSERAIRDEFVDAYVGKTYRPYGGVQLNEALAMGLERLSDPRAAGELALRDPDHLAMVLTALQQEPMA